MEEAENKYDQKYFYRNRHGIHHDQGRSRRIFKRRKNPRIIGIGESETKGIRHGYVVNIPLAVVSLKNAVSLAEKFRYKN